MNFFTSLAKLRHGFGSGAKKMAKMEIKKYLMVK